MVYYACTVYTNQLFLKGMVNLKTSLRNFFITLFASLLIFGVVAYFITNFVTGLLEDSIEGTPPVSLEIITSTESAEDTTVEGDEIVEITGESFTFAIIGTDYQPDILLDYNIEDNYTDSFPLRRNRTYSADSIAIVRADKDSRTLLISTIPSNMRLKVDGAFTTLGDIYYQKGVDFFVQKLTALTGFEIEKYFVIDVKSFAPIIDELGEITFNVPEDMNYSDLEQELTIDLKRGNQKLNGEMAEQLLRFNDYKSSENSREKTTAEFMLAVANKISDASFIKKANTLFTAISENITTNYTLNDLTANLELISFYKELNKTVTIYPGKYITINGRQFFEPDTKKAVGEYAAYR